MLTTSKFMSPAQTFPLSSKLVCLTVFSISPCNINRQLSRCFYRSSPTQTCSSCSLPCLHVSQIYLKNFIFDSFLPLTPDLIHEQILLPLSSESIQNPFILITSTAYYSDQVTFIFQKLLQ